MEVLEAISRRHSYRGPFKDQPVSRQDLQRIIQAGLQAPSAKNLQTTTFVAVDAPHLLEQIRAMSPNNQAMHTAQAYIACVMERAPLLTAGARHYQIEDCAAAVQTMLLAIASLGYASVWIDGWLRSENRADTIGKLLGVPPGKIIRVLLPIGVALEQHTQPEKLPFSRRAWFNQYGNDK